MLCPTCNGRGTVDGLTQVYPCPDCVGGNAHCCEGDQVQPVSEPESEQALENVAVGKTYRTGKMQRIELG